MCDYSLMARPNRLAVCGDELVVHRFELGTKGLAAAADLAPPPEPRQNSERGLFEKLKRFLFPPVPPPCPAVCIPPGARLLVRDIPAPLQKELKLEGPAEEVVFTQIDTVGFRDAIRFPNGTEVLLQRLSEGQRVRVLTLSSDGVHEPDRALHQQRRTLVHSGAGR